MNLQRNENFLNVNQINNKLLFFIIKKTILFESIALFDKCTNGINSQILCFTVF